MAVAGVGSSAQHGPRAPRLPIFLLHHPGHGVLTSCVFLMVADGCGCRQQRTREIASERRTKGEVSVVVRLCLPGLKTLPPVPHGSPTSVLSPRAAVGKPGPHP